MDRYALFFRRQRRLVLALVVLMSAVALFGLSKIEFDDVPREIFASEDEDYSRLLSLYDDFGSDDNDVLVVLESDDWFVPDRMDVLREMAELAAQCDGVATVTWFGSVLVFDGGFVPRPLIGASNERLEEARDAAHAHPLVNGRLLSDDGTVALVIARLRDELFAIEDVTPPVVMLREIAEELDGRASTRVRVTGIPPIRVDIYHIIQSEQVRFFLIGGVLCALVALLLFRSIGAVVCTTVPPLVGALWAYGFIGLVGVKLDLLSGILSMLVIVIALTDCVHLMIDVRISRGRGLDPLDAAVEAIRHVGLPCALTSLTTAVGFGSLAIASVPAIRQFGLLAAGSVFMAFFAVITLMPILASAIDSVEAPGGEKQRGRWMGLARPVVGFVLRHPLRITVAGVVATALFLVSSLQLEPENRLTEALPHDEPYEALLRCEEAFGGVLPNYVLIEWGEEREFPSDEILGVIAEVSDMLDRVEGPSTPLSILDVLASVPGGAENPSAAFALIPEAVASRFVLPEKRRALVMAQVPDGGTRQMRPIFASIRSGIDALAAEHSGFSLHLTGTDVVARSNVNRMIDDLARSLGFAAIIIFGVIALEFRSLRIGLLSLLPNLFPLVLVGAVLALLGIPLQMASAVLFTVLLGLAVDDTIHFLARYRREQATALPDADPLAALEAGYLAVGRAIVITTLILSVGFLTVSFSSVPTNRLFALLSFAGLMGALFGDLVLLPAMLAALGKRAAR